MVEMNWKRFGRKRSWSNRGTNLSSAWKERKTTTNLSQDGRPVCPSRDSNQIPLEHDSTTFPLHGNALWHDIGWQEEI
jgi:hypothetical protein